jgi:hypothetical protein
MSKRLYLRRFSPNQIWYISGKRVTRTIGRRVHVASSCFPWLQQGKKGMNQAFQPTRKVTHERVSLFFLKRQVTRSARMAVRTVSTGWLRQHTRCPVCDELLAMQAVTRRPHLFSARPVFCRTCAEHHDPVLLFPLRVEPGDDGNGRAVSVFTSTMLRREVHQCGCVHGVHCSPRVARASVANRSPGHPGRLLGVAACVRSPLCPWLLPDRARWTRQSSPVSPRLVPSPGMTRGVPSSLSCLSAFPTRSVSCFHFSRASFSLWSGDLLQVVAYCSIYQDLRFPSARHALLPQSWQRTPDEGKQPERSSLRPLLLYFVHSEGKEQSR